MRTFILILGAALALAALAAAAEGSQTTFRGKNGDVAFRRYLDKQQSSGALFTIKADGTGERQVTHPAPKGVDDQPDWAPDGSLLVFERCPAGGPCAVYTVRPDGLRLIRISPECRPGGKVPPCKDEGRSTFSPDGQRIAFGSYAGGSGNAIVVTNLRGLGRRVVVPRTRDVEVNDPQFSPNGKRLLFVRHNFGSAKPKDGIAIFAVNLDGTEVRQITPWSLAAGDNPDWSPDGKWILFRSDVPRVKQSQIYLIHPNGTGLTRLTLFKQGTTVTSSSFSPDGKSIVYGATGVGGNADIYVIGVDGRGMRPVTRTKLWDSAPDWGPQRTR